MNAPAGAGLAQALELDRSLLAQGFVDETTLARARQLRNANGQRLSQILLDLGALSPEQLCRAWSELTGIPVWDGQGDYAPDERFPEPFLSYNRVLPVRREGALLLALEDGEDDGLHDLLRRLAPEAGLVLCPPQLMARALAESIGGERGEQQAGDRSLVDDVEHLKDLALEAPIVRLVNDIITDGVSMGASDIHLEPFKNRLELRYRVDGVLHTRPAPPQGDYPAVVSRVKILADLDIAERRVPQDGRIRTRVAGRDVDIRVSTLATPHGEDLVLRLLDQKNQAIVLDTLGLSRGVLERFRAALERSNGLILVTGPTGSGKTTTLYAGIKEIIDGKKKIITVEDPVEYEIPGISQIQVNEAAGVTFSNSLRSILRHDPDVIFVGEIRDRETAEIAVQSSLTGHLVLSTIHTNSATGAIGRFLDMGVADYLLASSLIAVSAQRLLRRLCEHCKAWKEADADTAERFGLASGARIPAAVGCPKCVRTGYAGRLAISEFLEVDAALRRAILKNPSIDSLNKAVQGQRSSLLADGITKVIAGETTLEEVLRVAG